MLSEKEEEKVTPTQNTVETAPEARRNGSRTKLVVAFVVLVAAAVAAYAVYMHFRDRVSSDDANVDGHISAIAPKISGNVVEVAVLDNQKVKAGQVLVRIDPRDYQAAVDVAKAALAAGRKPVERRPRDRAVGLPTPRSPATRVASAQLADTETEVERARIAYEQANSSDLAYAQANVASKQAEQRSRSGRPGAHEAAGRQGRDLATAVRFLCGRRQHGR